MSITTIYRVSVNIPDDVYKAFSGELEWQRMRDEAVSDSFESGNDPDYSPGVWAEFEELSEARMCERMLNSMIEHFKGKL